MINLKKILSYINGTLSEKEKERFVLWLDSSNENVEEFNFVKNIDKLSNEVKEFELFDSEKEWEKIENLILEEEDKKSKYRFLRIISIAASILFIGFAVSTLFNESPTYKEVITLNNKDTLSLIDGSIVYLEENSRLKYFVKLDKKTNRRYVELDGNAIFNIARDENLPFVVKTNGAGIDVLGTIFKVNSLSDGVRVENVKGLINLFEWENASNSLLLKKGEKGEFRNGGIQKIIPKKNEKVMIGQYHKIEDILNLLFDKYDFRLSTSPYADIQMEDQVFVNTDQSLEQILSQLDTTSRIQFRKTCRNCFEISVWKSK